MDAQTLEDAIGKYFTDYTNPWSGVEDEYGVGESFDVDITAPTSVEVEVVDITEDYKGAYEKALAVVLRVGSQYFRKEGFYASFSGATWDGKLVEVFPQTKTVTVYEETFDAVDSYGVFSW